MKPMALGILLAALCGCSSVRVVRDYEPDYAFSSLETYAWKHAQQPETGNPRLDNDLYDERVRKAVDAELQAKGFRKVDKPEADFWVAYFVDYKQRISGGSFSFGLGTGGSGRYGGVGYNTGVSDYEEAHLTIDLIEPVGVSTPGLVIEDHTITFIVYLLEPV